jgi:hypothetical protein
LRTEVEEALEWYEFVVGRKVDIHAHWTSIEHVNWRRVVLQYRKLKEYGITLYDEMGNRKFMRKHLI